MNGVTEPDALAGNGEQNDGGLPPVAEMAMRVKLGRVERLLGLRFDEAHLPAWLRRTEGETRYPVAAAILVAIALQIFALPRDMAFRPWWVLPGLELALLIVLSVANPKRINRESVVLRGFGLSLVAVASWATAWSAGRLVYELVYTRTGVGDAPAL